MLKVCTLPRPKVEVSINKERAEETDHSKLLEKMLKAKQTNNSKKMFSDINDMSQASVSRCLEAVWKVGSQVNCFIQPNITNSFQLYNLNNIQHALPSASDKV